MQPRFVAILWPDEQNYARFREVNEGITRPDLESYRAAITPGLEALERSGTKVIRISFDVEQLVAFAGGAISGIKSETRAKFAMMEHHRQSGGKPPA